MIEQDGFSGLSSSRDGEAPDPEVGDPPAVASSETGVSEPGRDQPAIWDAEPEPRQLALIPDPDPWEADRPAPTSARPGGRLARRRRRNTTPPPDQLSLF